MNPRSDLATSSVEGLIGYREIFERIWQCRDFELSTLWQRSVLLGAFMVAAYAGYGALILNVFEKSNRVAWWGTLNLMAIGVCCFGLILSVLWIMMLKGSKAWYEIYERAIEDFRKTCPEAFKAEIVTQTRCPALAGFGIIWNAAHTSQINVSNGLFSGSSGCYSVSRVAILIGQVSLMGWIGLIAVHLVFLLKGYTAIADFAQNPRYMVVSALIFIGLCSFTVVKIRRSAHSSTLEALT